jgi:hypothetical protein
LILMSPRGDESHAAIAEHRGGRWRVFDSCATKHGDEMDGKSHIPPNDVVEGVPAQRKPPEVRMCRLSIQSGV